MMNEYRKVFDEYGVLYLENILTQQECDEALLKLFIAKENNQHVSYKSFNDNNVFDYCFEKDELSYLLPKVQQTIETILNIELFPTYSYSRIYIKGDILYLHTDRNSCEISISITLGYGGNSIWPFIFLSKNDTELDLNFQNNEAYWTNYNKDLLQKVEIKVGDGILYRGMEVAHGREVYNEGNWQAQLFLHYVDANGPNKQCKYDNIEDEEYGKIIDKGIKNGIGN